MSVTYQEPVPAGMVHAADPAGVLGDPSHYDGENPPSAGTTVPVRDLALLEGPGLFGVPGSNAGRPPG